MPYNWLGDAPACHPADDNGVADARQNGFGLVLDSKWVVGFNPAYVDLNALFVGWTGSEYIVPGLPGNFLAHYGTWSDLDWDGDLGPGEWSGDGSAFLVSYVTPAVVQNGVLVRTGGSAAPDVVYVVTSGPEGTRHVGSAPFLVSVDHSILETTAVWTLANPTFTPSADIDWSPTPGEPWDTDVYRSIDATLEALYQNTVQGTI